MKREGLGVSGFKREPDWEFDGGGAGFPQRRRGGRPCVAWTMACRRWDMGLVSRRGLRPSGASGAWEVAQES